MSKYKTLITDKTKDCEHKRIICVDCDAFAYIPNKWDSKAFLKSARAVAKTFREEEKKEWQSYKHMPPGTTFLYSSKVVPSND